MTDKKVIPHRKVPTVSQAPDPPDYISGGGYQRPSNTPARYKHWNLVPAVTIDQFTYLIFGCEPGTKMIWKETQKRADLLLLINAHEVVDTFPKPIDPWAANPLFRAVELIEWAESVGYRAHEDWKPMKPKEKRITKPERQRAEAMRAAKLMVLQKNPPDSMQDVVTFMLKNPDDYSECCGKKIGDQSLIKAINQRGGGNPLESQEYKTELAQFQSDKADKSDNSGHLPLVNLSKPK